MIEYKLKNILLIILIIILSYSLLLIFKTNTDNKLKEKYYNVTFKNVKKANPNTFVDNKFIKNKLITINDRLK